MFYSREILILSTYNSAEMKTGNILIKFNFLLKPFFKIQLNYSFGVLRFNRIIYKFSAKRVEY